MSGRPVDGGHGASGREQRRARLERRYRRLLLAYPAAYRAERGEELLGTYLDLAGPDRRWPGPGDVRDALGAGVRARLRTGGVLRLASGLPVAATIARTAAVALAAFWLLAVEVRPVEFGYLIVPFGPFQSLGAVAWLAWLGAGVATLALPARASRRLVLLAVAATAAVVPAAALSPFARPPLLVLVPQLALGAVALGGYDRPQWIGRSAPLAVAAVTAAFAAGANAEFGYHALHPDVLGIAAVGVLIVGLAMTGGLAYTGDRGALPALLILLVPGALLAVDPMSRTTEGLIGLPQSQWWVRAGVTAAIAVAAVGVLSLAAVNWGRRRTGRQSRPCPECGRFPGT